MSNGLYSMTMMSFNSFICVNGITYCTGYDSMLDLPQLFQFFQKYLYVIMSKSTSFKHKNNKGSKPNNKPKRKFKYLSEKERQTRNHEYVVTKQYDRVKAQQQHEEKQTSSLPPILSLIEQVRFEWCMCSFCVILTLKMSLLVTTHQTLGRARVSFSWNPLLFLINRMLNNCQLSNQKN
jgi:hypothetical protein